MLKVIYAGQLIEIRFYYKVGSPETIENETGVVVDDFRRCSIATVVIDGILVNESTVVCHPKDNFCKAIGRKKALTHAIAAFNKDQRRTIWNEYKVQCDF